MILGGGLPGLHGQSPNPGPAGPPVQVEIDFTVYGVGSETGRGLHFLAAEGQWRPLLFQSSDRSPRYHYKGPNPIRFGIDTGRIDTHGLPIWETRAEALCPTTKGRYLFFFWPSRSATSAGAETSVGLNLVVIDDSTRGLPVNHLLFFNATGAELMGVLGKKEIRLPNGLTGPLPVADSFGEDLFIGLVVRYADSFKKVLQNNWRFYPGNRTIMVLIPPRNPNSFRIGAIRLTDYVEENPETDLTRESSDATP